MRPAIVIYTPLSVNQHNRIDKYLMNTVEPLPCSLQSVVWLVGYRDTAQPSG